MTTIAVANLKGGVGKTTIAFNLACELAKKRGLRVLAVDNDPQGHLTTAFLKDSVSLASDIYHAYQEQEIVPHVLNKSLHLIGADEKLAQVTDGDIDTLFLLKEALQAIQNQGQEYDFIIIDCLPSSSFIQMAALAAADWILIPVKPSGFDFKGMVSFIKNIEKIRARLNPGLELLGMIINQADGRGPVYERDLEAALRGKYANLIFQTNINKRIDIATSPALNKPIVDYSPKSASAQEFKVLAKEVLQRIKEKRNG